MSALPAGLEQYSATPVFTEATVPAALRREHALKAGTWGRLTVQRGRLEFTDLVDRRTTVLGAGDSHVIAPEAPHFVAPKGAVAFRIDFFR